MANTEDVFTEAEQRQKHLLEQFATAPISDVWAVVGANGPGGGRSGGETLWTMSFTVEAWRVAGGEIQKRPLRVSRVVNDEELKSFQKLIRPYEVVRIQARVVESADDGPKALLEVFQGRDSTVQELNNFANELQKPITFEDSIFGTFTLDRQVNWFTCNAFWAGEPIELNLSEAAQSDAALKNAHALWQNQEVWNQRVRDFAVAELLSLKNENWLNEDEEELTPDEFKARMTLEAIKMNADGSFDFWHNDGDLFWGHVIQISGSLSEGLKYADIPG